MPENRKFLNTLYPLTSVGGLWWGGGEDLSSRLTHLGEPSPALPMVIVMTQVPPMGLAATPQPGHEATLRETGVGTCWEVFNKQLSQEGTPISMV